MGGVDLFVPLQLRPRSSPDVELVHLRKEGQVLVADLRHRRKSPVRLLAFDVQLEPSWRSKNNLDHNIIKQQLSFVEWHELPCATDEHVKLRDVEDEVPRKPYA